MLLWYIEQLFYSHFSDKYELLDYVIKNLEDDLLAGFDVTDYSSSRDFYKGLIDNLLEFLGSNKIFLEVFLIIIIIQVL